MSRVKNILMHLVLAVGDTPLEKLPIDPARYRDAKYLHAVKRLLLIKNRLAIKAFNSEPFCYLQLPSGVLKQKPN